MELTMVVAKNESIILLCEKLCQLVIYHNMFTKAVADVDRAPEMIVNQHSSINGLFNTCFFISLD